MWKHPSVRTKLVQLEREISQLGRTRAHTRSVGVKKKRRQKTLERALGDMATTFKLYGRTVAASFRGAINATIRRAPIPLTMASGTKSIAQNKDAAPSKKQTAWKSTNVVGALLAMSFGLIAICIILVVALFQQVKDMKSEMNRWEANLTATNLSLAKTEKLTQRIASEKPVTASSAPPYIPLALSKDEKRLIRQFIKVIPPKPGAIGTIHVGDRVPSAITAQVPQELVRQVPKLRGARFLIDHDGTIVVMREGSDRADAIVEYQQQSSD